MAGGPVRGLSPRAGTIEQDSQAGQSRPDALPDTASITGFAISAQSDRCLSWSGRCPACPGRPGAVSGP
jgi:hypothetical protein